MLNLSDTCIIPILLHGSEVWAPFMNHDWVKRDTTQTENTHSILKNITRGKYVNN